MQYPFNSLGDLIGVFFSMDEWEAFKKSIDPKVLAELYMQEWQKELLETVQTWRPNLEGFKNRSNLEGFKNCSNLEGFKNCSNLEPSKPRRFRKPSRF